MAVKRRIFSPKQKVAVKLFAEQKGRQAALDKFKLHASTYYAWLKADKDRFGLTTTKPEGGPVAYDKSAGNPPSREAILYLRSARRAGPTAKGHLLAMLALETLEGR